MMATDSMDNDMPSMFSHPSERTRRPALADDCSIGRTAAQMKNMGKLKERSLRKMYFSLWKKVDSASILFCPKSGRRKTREKALLQLCERNSDESTKTGATHAGLRH
jgi:hypothetical protein